MRMGGGGGGGRGGELNRGFTVQQRSALSVSSVSSQPGAVESSTTIIKLAVKIFGLRKLYKGMTQIVTYIFYTGQHEISGREI